MSVGWMANNQFRMTLGGKRLVSVCMIYIDTASARAKGAEMRIDEKGKPLLDVSFHTDEIAKPQSQSDSLLSCC
jgi:hypothetical protein